MRTLGIIGGSGLYEIDGLHDLSESCTSTPFGQPSDAILEGTLENTRLLFLPRHGRKHQIPPHRINYRANVFALKKLGAEQVVSVSAVGSMKEQIHPGDMVLVDQFIDLTKTRPPSFFDEAGMVAHVSLADPTDASLRDALKAAAKDAGIEVHASGTYVCIEGPQFSTRAESNLYRTWGAAVIGMTNMPEARLAREAELPYATLALATDYDCWHDTEDAVSVDAVLEVMAKTVARAKEVIKNLPRHLPDPAKSPSAKALAQAVVTPRKHVPVNTHNKLALLLEPPLADKGTTV